MKKLLLTLVCVFLVLLNTHLIVNAEEKPIVTVTTSFLADMVKQISGEHLRIETLIPAGSDPHLYQAKTQDLKKISQADLVLYHGLHFEGKMVDILEQYGQAVSKDFNPSLLGKIDEMNGTEIDPHFWFDIDLYKQAVTTTSIALQERFPDLAGEISKRTTIYQAELDKLKEWVKTELAVLPIERRLLVTPHDAFNYFARSNHFTVYAPQGISTDSEVSNQQIGETVDFIIKNNVPAIFVESTTNPDRMKKLQEAVKAKGGNVEVVNKAEEVLFSDSLAPIGQNGDTYISMYQHNLNIIIKYLSKP